MTFENLETILLEMRSQQELELLLLRRKVEVLKEKIADLRQELTESRQKELMSIFQVVSEEEAETELEAQRRGFEDG